MLIQRSATPRNNHNIFILKLYMDTRPSNLSRYLIIILTMFITPPLNERGVLAEGLGRGKFIQWLSHSEFQPQPSRRSPKILIHNYSLPLFIPSFILII